MSEWLEELKVRLSDAQKRLQVTQVEMGAVQSRFQSVATEVGSLQHLLNMETARLQSESAGGSENMPNPQGDAAPKSQSTEAAVLQFQETNKTAAVREMIRQRPGGVTATDLWKQVKTQMKHRAYLYSILKRLRDKDEVMVRRGKYIAKIAPKTEENKEHQVATFKISATG